MSLQFYSKLRKLEMRSAQIFALLVAAAHRRETLTYALLAKKLGFKGAGVFAKQLGLIMRWCDSYGLPPLTVLVVNSETGLPGEGLTTPIDVHAEREKVFSYNWIDLVPPTADELARFSRY